VQSAYSKVLLQCTVNEVRCLVNTKHRHELSAQYTEKRAQCTEKSRSKDLSPQCAVKDSCARSGARFSVHSARRAGFSVHGARSRVLSAPCTEQGSQLCGARSKVFRTQCTEQGFQLCGAWSKVLRARYMEQGSPCTVNGAGFSVNCARSRVLSVRSTE
jgi:hypothetical protein